MFYASFFAPAFINQPCFLYSEIDYMVIFSVLTVALTNMLFLRAGVVAGLS